jgi:hypothetical protein
VTARLAELGASATDEAPLAHLFAEPTRRTPESRHEFWVCAETWSGAPSAVGEREYLGTMAAHGVPVHWEEHPG